MNNPVGGATVGGAEFQRLNPFAESGGNESVAASSSGKAADQNAPVSAKTGAVSFNSTPEMTALAPMNDINVLFMMF